MDQGWYFTHLFLRIYASQFNGLRHSAKVLFTVPARVANGVDCCVVSIADVDGDVSPLTADEPVE